ncbi:MAG: nucleoside recognition domain-containing protein, partial [Robiginitalea sp.]
YQALTLMLLYLLGFAASILAAKVLHQILKVRSRSFFMVEMPNYKWPLWKNVFYTVVEKTKSFVYGAGKIILAISIVLWFLGSNGFSEEFKNADQIITERVSREGLSPNSQAFVSNKLEEFKTSLPVLISGVDNRASNIAMQDSLSKLQADLRTRVINQEIASYRLEHSFIGKMGKFIEPAVRPLGYDWKIGIAVLTSFAAREVFVGTLATIYSVGNDEEETIKNRMAAEVKADGQPLFNLASGVSLMLFYAFAMQCMSTLAIVKRETNSWKWPMLQLVFMTVIAYLAALTAYQLLS